MDNNLNEEIRRIKTLFTEERLYGNLVENLSGTTKTPSSLGILNVGSKGRELPIAAATFDIEDGKGNVEHSNQLLTVSAYFTPNDVSKDPNSYLNNYRTSNAFLKINGKTFAHLGSDGYVKLVNAIPIAGLYGYQEEYLYNFIVMMLSNIDSESFKGIKGSLNSVLKRVKVRNKLAKLNSKSDSSQELLSNKYPAEKGNELIGNVDLNIELDSPRVEKAAYREL